MNFNHIDDREETIMNLKIFPAFINREGQKIPLIKGWYENASNDPVQIKKWQDEHRERIQLWGVPCGEVNGIVALDIDVKKINGVIPIKSDDFKFLFICSDVLPRPYRTSRPVASFSAPELLRSNLIPCFEASIKMSC